VAQKANLSFKNKIPYISVIDEASDFKFGKQQGFAKADHQVSLEKSGFGHWLEELFKMCGSPIIFLLRLKLF